MSAVETYIGVFDLDSNKILKTFRVRVFKDGAKAKIILKFKSKSGDSKRLVKSFESKPGRHAVIGCIQAVCKYWPKFDPAKHRPALLSQDERKAIEKKRSKRSA